MPQVGAFLVIFLVFYTLMGSYFQTLDVSEQVKAISLTVMENNG